MFSKEISVEISYFLHRKIFLKQDWLKNIITQLLNKTTSNILLRKHVQSFFSERIKYD